MIMKTDIRLLDNEKEKLEDALSFFRSIEEQIEQKDRETCWSSRSSQRAFLDSLERIAMTARISTQISLESLNGEIEIERKKDERV